MRNIGLLGLLSVMLAFTSVQAQTLPREVRTQILEAVVQVIPVDSAERAACRPSGFGHGRFSPDGLRPDRALA
ncbi:MAG: hypothetical protein U5L04_13350 [Trueperaceae bacterium]|nr:hypothetical protein [Trueperaceae bacterium]